MNTDSSLEHKSEGGSFRGSNDTTEPISSQEVLVRWSQRVFSKNVHLIKNPNLLFVVGYLGSGNGTVGSIRSSNSYLQYVRTNLDYSNF